MSAENVRALVEFLLATLPNLDSYVESQKQERRNFDLKVREKRSLLNSDFASEVPPSDQMLGVPAPPIVSLKPSLKVIALPDQENSDVTVELRTVLEKRRSRRLFSGESLSFRELGFLLWSCSGVTGPRDLPKAPRFRTAPSGGARHAIDTYILVTSVEGLEEGVYQYLPAAHEIALIKSLSNLSMAACVRTFTSQLRPWVSAPVLLLPMININSMKLLVLMALMKQPFMSLPLGAGNSLFYSSFADSKVCSNLP